MAAYKLKEIESIEKIISIKDLYNIWPLDAYPLKSFKFSISTCDSKISFMIFYGLV